MGDIVTELAEAVAALHAQLTGMATRIDLGPHRPGHALPDAGGGDAPARAGGGRGGATPRRRRTPRRAAPTCGAARLLALNMALNGMEREELDRHLAERFDIPNRAALLDDVYHRRPLRARG